MIPQATQQPRPHTSRQVVDNHAVTQNLNAQEMNRSALPLSVQQQQQPRPENISTGASLPEAMAITSGLGRTTTPAESSEQAVGNPYALPRYAAYREDREATQSPTTTPNDPTESYGRNETTAVPEEAPLQKEGNDEFLDVFSELMTGSEHELSFLMRHFSEVLGPWYAASLRASRSNALTHPLAC